MNGCSVAAQPGAGADPADNRPINGRAWSAAAASKPLMGLFDGIAAKDAM
jgi:hypothetical protein